MVGRALLSGLSIVVVVWLLKIFVAGTPLDEKQLLGMTPPQVRAEHGDPFYIRDVPPNHVEWLYAHGFIGTASLVRFREGVVVRVSVRYGK